MINNVGIHATGNIRNISFISGTMYLLCPIISWLILKYFQQNASVVYIVDIVLYVIITLLGLYFLKVQISEINILRYILKTLRSIITTIFSFAVTYFIMSKLHRINATDIWIQLTNLFTCGIIGIMVLSAVSFVLTLDITDRIVLLKDIKVKIGSLKCK